MDRLEVRISQDDRLAVRQRALMWVSRGKGANSRRALNGRQEIADFLLKSGELDEALLVQQKVYEDRRIRSPDDRDTLWSEHRLGVVLHKLDRLDEAKSHFANVVNMKGPQDQTTRQQ